jgi:ABC-2 type transport system ATP-binding protein
MAAALQARGLTKRFGSRTAVAGFSLTAGRGDIVGLLGPNGAGKTTAIRMLTTMLAPTSGDFTVDGVPSGRPNEVRRRIGVLPESAGYPDRQTAAEYLAFYGQMFGRSRQDAARVATRLLADVGLSSRASSPIVTFSRGMRQRLGIARALVNDPAVVFLDEPTLGLDPAGQRQVLAIVRDIAGRGATVVVSTHLLSEVAEVCNRALILDHGRVVTQGSVSDVIQAGSGPRRADLRVPPELLDSAWQAVCSVPGLSADADGERPGVLTVTVAQSAGSGSRELNLALRAVLDADVPVLYFQLDASRLTEAFLALTSVSEL